MRVIIKWLRDGSTIDTEQGHRVTVEKKCVSVQGKMSNIPLSCSVASQNPASTSHTCQIKQYVPLHFSHVLLFLLVELNNILPEIWQDLVTACESSTNLYFNPFTTTVIAPCGNGGTELCCACCLCIGAWILVYYCGHRVLHSIAYCSLISGLCYVYIVCVLHVYQFSPLAVHC